MSPRPFPRSCALSCVWLVAVWWVLALRPAGLAQTVVTSEYATAVDGPITSGNWEFRDPSGHILVNSVSGVTGGQQDFYGSSYAEVSVASGLVGGTQIFHDTSQLRVQVTQGVGTASITLSDSASILLNASNALSTSTNVTFNSVGAALNLNGYSTDIGVLSSTSGQAFGTISNGGSGTAATLTTNFDTQTATFGGTITGSNLSLTKDGTGILVLTNGSNSYGGGTTLVGGTLQVNASNALGTGSVSLVSGTLQGAGGTRTLPNSFTIDGNVSLGPSLNLTGTVALTGDRTITLVGVTTFATGVSETTPSALTLTGAAGTGASFDAAAGYTGATTISGPTLVLRNSGTLSGANLVLSEGGVLAQQGTFSRTLGTGVGQVQFGANGGGFAAFNGPLTVSGFTGNPVWGVTPGFLDTGALVLGSNFANNVVTWTTDFSLGAATRTLTGTDAGGTSDRGVISGIISGDAGSGIIKSGTARIDLTGANTYTGSTAITNGTLGAMMLGNVGAGSGSFGAPATLADGTIALGSAANTGTLIYLGAGESTNRVIDLAGTTGGGGIDSSGTGALILTSNFTATGVGNKTLTLTGTNTANNEIAGIIADSGPGSLTSVSKVGTATWKLSGANTFTGNFSLGAGTLIMGNDAALGGGTFVFSGGTLSSDGPARTVTNNVTLSGGTLAGPAAFTFTGPVTVNGFATLNVSNTGGVALGAININNLALNRTLTFNATSNVTVSGVVADGFAGTSGSLSKLGTGTLTLNGANTFSGGLTAQGGNIVLGNNAALGTGPVSVLGSTLVGDGTARTIANNVNFTVGTIGGNSPITFTGTVAMGNFSTLNLTNTGGTTFNAITLGANTTTTTITVNATTGNGVVTGPITDGPTGAVLSLTKSNSGGLTLSGANTFTGVLFLNGGNLTAAGGAGSLGAGSLTLQSGTLTLLSDSSLNYGRNTRFTGVSSIVIDRATSGAGVTQTFGTLSIETSALFTVSAGANVTSGIAGLAFGATTFTSQFPTIRVNSGASLDLGAVDPGGSTRFLTKSGAGMLQFGGNAWAAGSGLTVNEGTLRLTSDNVLGVAGGGNVTVTAQAGSPGLVDLNGHNLAVAYLTMNGTSTAGSSITTGAGLLSLGNDVTFSNSTTQGASISGRLELSAGNHQFLVNDSTNATTELAISAVVSGAGGLNKTGNGVVALSGSNTYSGNTTLAQGTLGVGSDSALGTGTLIASGGTLRVDGGAHTLANPVVTSFTTTFEGSSALTFSNTLTTSSSSVLFVNSSGGLILNDINISNAAGTRVLAFDGTGNVTVNGVIADGFAGATGNLTKAGSVTLTLNGSNTYSGVTNVNGGTLRLGNDLALGSGTLSMASGTLQVIGGNRTISNRFDPGNVTVDTNGFDLVWGGLYTTSATVNKTGAGAFVLGGTVVNFGTVNLQAGQLQLGGGGTSGGEFLGGVINASAGTQVIFNRSNAAAFSGNITGAGSVRKIGVGTLTVSQPNVYSGGTTIAQGTININNGSGSAFGIGSVTVDSGASLTGQGSFTGALQNNGTYVPAAFSGATILSVFTQGASGLLQMDIGGLTRGSGYKALDISGAFTPGGTLAITFSNAFSPTTGASFDLFNFGFITGTFSSLSLPTLGSNQVWDTSALYSTGTLTVSAIPEPSTYALGVGLMALALGWIRRRR